jgi:hypothetical protein
LGLFKSSNFMRMIYEYNLESHTMKKLINNHQQHWSEEINMLSKLVISKMLSYDKNLINLLDAKNQEILEKMSFTNLNDDLWNYRYDLKADIL